MLSSQESTGVPRQSNVSVLLVVRRIFKNTAWLNLVTSHSHSHSHPHTKHPHAEKEFDQFARNQSLAKFLEAHFGEVELHIPDELDESEQGEDEHDVPSLFVQLDEADATINLVSLVRADRSGQTVMLSIVTI